MAADVSDASNDDARSEILPADISAAKEEKNKKVCFAKQDVVASTWAPTNLEAWGIGECDSDMDCEGYDEWEVEMLSQMTEEQRSAYQCSFDDY